MKSFQIFQFCKIIPNCPKILKFSIFIIYCQRNFQLFLKIITTPIIFFSFQRVIPELPISMNYLEIHNFAKLSNILNFSFLHYLLLAVRAKGEGLNRPPLPLGTALECHHLSQLSNVNRSN